LTVRASFARRAAAFCVCESKRHAARFRAVPVLGLGLVLVEYGVAAGDGDY